MPIFHALFENAFSPPVLGSHGSVCPPGFLTAKFRRLESLRFPISNLHSSAFAWPLPRACFSRACHDPPPCIQSSRSTRAMTRTAFLWIPLARNPCVAPCPWPRGSPRRGREDRLNAVVLPLFQSSSLQHRIPSNQGRSENHHSTAMYCHVCFSKVSVLQVC